MIEANTGWSGEHAPPIDTPAPDLTAEPESMVVRMDTGEQIHYLDWSESRAPSDSPGRRPGGRLPPVLLVHGLSQTAWIWVPVARRLCRATQVVAPDLRGHGLSEAPRSGYDLESLAMDMLTVLTANGLGRDAGGPPAVVVGHGFGAQVAATMAALRPESIAGVALVDGGWEDVGEATRLSPAEYLAAIAEPPEVLASMETFLADRRDFDPATWDVDQERAARSQVEQKYAGHVAPVTRPVSIRLLVDSTFAYRPDEVLPRVECPLLVLVAESGGADDESVRERRLALEDVVAARERAGFPAPRTVRFAGVGHNLMRYVPGKVAAEILGLLGSATG